MQITCCAPLWKITSRNMVQMMQIQGMQYGVENSLKTSLQEVSFKNVVCAGNVEKKHSKPASKISLFLPQERNSQSWIQKPPCAFLSLSCYPQINKVNKMFVLLAHQSKRCERTSAFLLKLWPAVPVSSCWNCRSKAKRTPRHLLCIY